MDVVPVAKNGQDQQQKRDEEQTRGFGGVNRVPMVFVGMIGLRTLIRHADIVARGRENSMPREVRQFSVKPLQMLHP
jgi:hypothetical protein